MASQVLPLGVSPIDLKTFSSRCHLLLGLALMLLERGPEVFRLRRLCHLGQRGQDFLFGEVDVLQRVEKEVLKCLVFGHGRCPLEGNEEPRLLSRGVV